MFTLAIPASEPAWDRNRSVARTESEKIAEGLPFLKRFGFYGSQVAVHAVALLVFVKTGGLTGTEVAVQGLSSPLLAKVVGTLLAEGEATALEERLRGHYRDAVHEKTRSWLDHTQEEQAQIRAWLPSSEEWQEACSLWDRGD